MRFNTITNSVKHTGRTLGAWTGETAGQGAHRGFPV